MNIDASNFLLSIYILRITLHPSLIIKINVQAAQVQDHEWVYTIKKFSHYPINIVNTVNNIDNNLNPLYVHFPADSSRWPKRSNGVFTILEHHLKIEC